MGVALADVLVADNDEDEEGAILLLEVVDERADEVLETEEVEIDELLLLETAEVVEVLDTSEELLDEVEVLETVELLLALLLLGTVEVLETDVELLLLLLDRVDVLETEVLLLVLLLESVQVDDIDELLEVDETEEVLDTDEDESVVFAADEVDETEFGVPVALELDDMPLEELDDDVDVGVMLLDDAESVDELVAEAEVLDGTPPVDTMYAPQAPAWEAAAPTVDL